MNNQKLTESFNETFKFNINDPVMHRGDRKKFDADMSLLVLKRILVETESDDGRKSYERHYHCRMIRFSGSGDIAQFSEKELVSRDEYEENRLRDDFEMNQRRDDIKRTEKEVMQIFDINKEDYVYLKKDGVVDKSKKYRMTGFSNMDGVLKLLLTESLLTSNNNKEGVKKEHAEVSNKDEFEKVLVAAP